MAFTTYTVTQAGAELLLGCMATGDFEISALVLGSGSYDGDRTQIGDVVAPEARFEGDSLSVVKNGEQLEITARLTNDQLENGFDWREYGVYATDGTQTVLYCYDNAGEDAIPISSADDGMGISSVVKVILTIDQAATVNVSFEPAAAVTVDDAVTEDGQNAVSGAAVYAFVAEHVPDTVPASSVTAGMLAGAVQANEAAMASLDTAMLRNVVILSSDPGEGAETGYPAGTVVIYA